MAFKYAYGNGLYTQHRGTTAQDFVDVMRGVRYASPTYYI